jgi:hypothetical protein
MDGDLMAIIHYDMENDDFREVTQEDWDLMMAGAHRIHWECIALQALLRDRGIPLPENIMDRATEDDFRLLEARGLR